MEPYATSVLGLLLLCLVSILLAIYSGYSKGMAGLASGPVPDPRDENRLHRIDRVHMNSVEALAPFAVPAILGILAGVTPALLATLVWLHVAIRLVHLAIYLRGGKLATGGNLRTVLYVASTIVTMILVGVTAWQVLA